MNKEFKVLPIPGFEGVYEINENGDVWSMHQYPKMQRKITIHKLNGYCYVSLNHPGQRQRGYRIHRLVAMAFIPNPDNLPQINHKDFDKQNNHVSNLEWCDAFYNQQHAVHKPNRKWQRHRLGMTGSKNPKSIMVEVFKGGISIGIYESMCLAAKATGSDQAKISACCRGVRKTHNNLQFKYA